MDEMTFEQAMKELETIVRRMESGEPLLDESIILFQKGVVLSKICSEKLDAIEKRIVQLVEMKSGEIVEQPFGLPDPSDV